MYPRTANKSRRPAPIPQWEIHVPKADPALRWQPIAFASQSPGRWQNSPHSCSATRALSRTHRLPGVCHARWKSSLQRMGGLDKSMLRWFRCPPVQGREVADVQQVGFGLMQVIRDTVAAAAIVQRYETWLRVVARVRHPDIDGRVVHRDHGPARFCSPRSVREPVRRNRHVDRHLLQAASLFSRQSIKARNGAGICRRLG